jgi:hypothetical protein
MARGIRIPLLWVDHRPRIEFYVRQGLVTRAPSDAQIARAIDQMKTKVGVLGQILFYSRNPRLILPSRAKQIFVDNPRNADDARPRTQAPAELAAQRAALPAFDRWLRWLLLFSPARFAIKTFFNPWEALPSAGFNSPAWCLIAHTLQTTHPAPGIWDIQVIHPDPGALDSLERQVDRALLGRGLRARIDRALGCQPNQFEDLKALIPRIRRFDYPPMPAGVDPVNEDVVAFLNHAAEL